MQHYRIFDRRRLLLLLWLLLTAGFLATSLIGYQVSKKAIRDAIIGQDLPLTSSNIYSEIQKDLVRPVLIASTMANDTFLRDWILQGERDIGEVSRYLREMKERYGAFSSFFVSDKSGSYYTGAGLFKRVARAEERDAWYFRVRDMAEDYEINVDPDLANQDALTIFINYRVFDFNHRYIGATGIGLTVDAVRRLIRDYQQRYQRTIYFVDQKGKVVLFANGSGQVDDLRSVAGLGAQIDTILQARSGSFQYLSANGDNHILNVNYLPELKWYLFVEQNEEASLVGVRRTLYTNLLISFLVTLVVVYLIHLTLMRYQHRLEDMASTDKLTGLLNRHAFTILVDKILAEYRRQPQALTVLLADVDYFKVINDQHGHLVGDEVLATIAKLFKSALRESDLAVRWGGEEFLLLLRGCDVDEAQRIAEGLRKQIEQASVMVKGQPVSFTISIGVAQYDGQEATSQTVNRADVALYEAKEAGRNRIVVDRTALT
jgi:diguanylate cyclase (GGDEF)-like protein